MKYDLSLLHAYPHKVGSEMIWHYFEKMGFVESFDIVEEGEYNKDLEKNYDFVVTMKSDYDGQRDERSVINRKYEYFITNTKNGKTSKIIERATTPKMLGSGPIKMLA